MRGCPAISYGWGRGHVRVNNAAFRRFGLAEVAETPAELRAAVARALERGRTVTDVFAGFPPPPRSSSRPPMRAEHASPPAALAAWCAPAAAPVVPARSRRRSASRCGSRRARDRPHLRRRPAPAGHAGGARRARPRRRARDLLPRRRAGRAPAGARGGDRRLPATRSGSTATGTSCCCAARRARCATTSSERPTSIARRPAPRRVLYRPPYGVFSPPGARLVRGWAGTPLLWSRWGRDWEARATPESIAARATADLGAGDVVLLHDADFYSSADSWRKTVGGAAGGARRRRPRPASRS